MRPIFFLVVARKMKWFWLFLFNDDLSQNQPSAIFHVDIIINCFHLSCTISFRYFYLLLLLFLNAFVWSRKAFHCSLAVYILFLIKPVAWLTQICFIIRNVLAMMTLVHGCMVVGGTLSIITRPGFRLSWVKAVNIC